MGVVRREHPEVEQHFIDLVLSPQKIDDFKKCVRELMPDLVIYFISAYYINRDTRWILPGYRSMGIIVPAFIDPKEALSLYDIPVGYLTNCDELEMIISGAISELKAKGDIREAKGLVINRDGVIADTGHPGFSDLTSFPLPAYDLMGMDKYIEKNLEVHKDYRPELLHRGVFHTQKGCPNECIFCGGSAKNTISREKSAEQMFEEVSLLYDKYGIRMLSSGNSEFFTDIDEGKKFCRLMIASPIKDLVLIYNHRTEFVDRELLGLMKKAGIGLIRYGIETADPVLQKKINKNIDLKKAGRALRMTQAAGIRALVYMTIGFEGETKSSLMKNADFLADNEIDMFTDAILFVIPGTKMYYDFKKAGKLLNNDWGKFKTQEKLLFKNSSYADIGQLKKAKRFMRRRYFLKRALIYLKGKKFNFALDCLMNHFINYNVSRIIIDLIKNKTHNKSTGRVLEKAVDSLAHRINRDPYKFCKESDV